MHAAIPHVSRGLGHAFGVGLDHPACRALVEHAGGRLVAEGMALALELGFGYVMRNSLVDPAGAESGSRFFEEHFRIVDPHAPGGSRYYQGRFLFRTRRAGEEMNVLLEFCPDPARLFLDAPWGRCLDPTQVVRATAVDESRARELERSVDLVIRFRDTEAILGLVGRKDGTDVVQMLLDNLVQLTGNTGHLFKLGAIGAGVQEALA